MVNVTAVHMSGGERHEHIAEVRWNDPASGKTESSSRATMVDWIENKNGKAYVKGNGATAQVGVVNATPKYIRTYADGVWTDNLLALPRY